MNNMSAYYANRDLMDTGDAVEFRTSGPVGGTIRLFTGADVNHSAIIIRLTIFVPRTAGAQVETEDHIYILEANPRGTELHRLSVVLENHKGAAYWLPLRGRLDYQKNIMADWILNHEGIEYDYKSLFKNALARVSADANKLFCSETVFLAWRDANIIPFSTTAPRPSELAQYNVTYPRVKII